MELRTAHVQTLWIAQMEVHASQERVRTRLAIILVFVILLLRKGSSAEYKHDCNRKSCCVPVAIDNFDHDLSSAVKFHETFTHEWHSCHNLDGKFDGHRRLKVDPWWFLPLLASSS